MERSPDKRPSGNPLHTKDDGSVVWWGMKVNGLGYVVLKASLEGGKWQFNGLAAISDEQAQFEGVS